MLTVSTPAPMMGTLALVFAGRLATRALVQAMLHQLNRSLASYAFHDEAGTLIAVAGFFPDHTDQEHETAELWFAVAPGQGRHTLALARCCRLTCARITQDYHTRITAHVLRTNTAGARLVRASGGRFLRETDTGAFYVWRKADGDDVQGAGQTARGGQDGAGCHGDARDPGCASRCG